MALISPRAKTGTEEARLRPLSTPYRLLRKAGLVICMEMIIVASRAIAR